MKFQDDISNMNTYIRTDKPKPICPPPLFQSWGHNYNFSSNNIYLDSGKNCCIMNRHINVMMLSAISLFLCLPCVGSCLLYLSRKLFLAVFAAVFHDISKEMMFLHQSQSLMHMRSL